MIKTNSEFDSEFVGGVYGVYYQSNRKKAEKV